MDQLPWSMYIAHVGKSQSKSKSQSVWTFLAIDDNEQPGLTLEPNKPMISDKQSLNCLYSWTFGNGQCGISESWDFWYASSSFVKRTFESMDHVLYSNQDSLKV